MQTEAKTEANRSNKQKQDTDAAEGSEEGWAVAVGWRRVWVAPLIVWLLPPGPAIKTSAPQFANCEGSIAK